MLREDMKKLLHWVLLSNGWLGVLSSCSEGLDVILSIVAASIVVSKDVAHYVLVNQVLGRTLQ